MTFETFVVGVIVGISLLMFLDWYTHKHDDDDKGENGS